MALKHRGLTRELIGYLITVHNEIGPGLDESIYQEACEEIFRSKSIPFKPQVSKWVVHRKTKVKELIPDFLVDKKIILDLKAIYGNFPPAPFPLNFVINPCLVQLGKLFACIDY